MCLSPCPHESKLSTGTAPNTNAALSCGACFCIALCGGGGIRTPGTLPFNSFQDCRHRPLGHTSGIADCKDNDKKLSRQILFGITNDRAWLINVKDRDLSYSFSGSSPRAKNLYWKNIRYSAPTVTQLSAKLNTGEKKMKCLPPTNGIHEGQLASIRGK